MKHAIKFTKKQENVLERLTKALQNAHRQGVILAFDTYNNELCAVALSPAQQNAFNRYTEIDELPSEEEATDVTEEFIDACRELPVGFISFDSHDDTIVFTRE